MISSKTRFWFGALLLTGLLPVAQAQTQRSGGDTARVVQQLQQLTAEKTALQTDLDAVRKELEDLKAKYVQANAAQGKLQQRARELETAGATQQLSSRSSEEALEKSRTQLTELIGKFRETTQLLKDVETERDTLRASATMKERELTSCVDKNAQMYLLSDEVLNRLEDRGLWSTLKSKEPFTQLSRTRLENLADDYRDRIRQLKLADASAATAVPR